MITKTTEDIQKFANVTDNFKLDKLKPFLNRAIKDYLYKYISKTQYKTLSEYTGTDEEIKEAVELASEVEVNIAMFNYLNVAGMQVTSGGVHIISPQQQKDATKQDLRDALRLYKKTGLTALDDLLVLLEENEAKFNDWKNSKAFTKQKELLVNTTSDFQKGYNIFNSTQTFLSLLPDLYRTENKYIIPVLTGEVLKQLKAKDTTSFTAEQKTIFTNVYETVQDAIVLFTVSNTLGSGMYVQEATGFQLRFDLLDYERNFTSAKKLDSYIEKQAEDAAFDANQFLKQAKNLIKNNTDVFPSYVLPSIKASNRFLAGKGIVGI